jgi:hypothetical protein
LSHAAPLALALATLAAQARFGCSSGRQLRPIPTSSAPAARLAPIIARARDIVVRHIRRNRRTEFSSTQQIRAFIAGR